MFCEGFSVLKVIMVSRANAKYAINDQNGPLQCLAGDIVGAKMDLIEIFPLGGRPPPLSATFYSSSKIDENFSSTGR